MKCRKSGHFVLRECAEFEARSSNQVVNLDVPCRTRMSVYLPISWEQESITARPVSERGGRSGSEMADWLAAEIELAHYEASKAKPAKASSPTSSAELRITLHVS